MKLFLLFTLLIIITANINAQNTEWTVPAGSSIQETLGDGVVYQYPQFIQGFVYFRDGKTSRATLNYNLVTGEIQFITPSNDTLAVANEITLRFVAIGADTFYFDKFYIEQLHNNGIAKLGKVEAITQSDLRREGGFGQMSSTTGISTLSSIYTGSQSYKLTEKSEVTMHKKTIYFIGDNFNHFLMANKKNIYKMFNAKAAAIESFLKENKTSFTDEANLNKLVDFIGQN